MTAAGTSSSSLPWFVHGRALAHSAKGCGGGGKGQGGGRRVWEKTLLILQAPLAGDGGVTAEIQSVTSLAARSESPRPAPASNSAL